MAQPRPGMIPVLLVLGLLLAWPAPAALAGERQPGLAVTGRASQEFSPDQGRLVVGAITLAPTSAEAARQNAAVMEKISATVKARLGGQDRLKSVGYSLYPRSEWDQATRRAKRVGYEASNRLEVTSRDPQALGAILDAAVAAGANSVSGPAWSLADPAAARRQVQALALADALAQAQALASAAGLKLGAILALEVDGATPPLSSPKLAMAAPPGAPAPETALEPGMIAVQATVRCLFAISPQP